jgi:hypothetical protein
MPMTAKTTNHQTANHLCTTTSQTMHTAINATETTTSTAMHTAINAHQTSTRPSTLRSVRIQHTEAEHEAQIRASQRVNVAADEIAWFYTSYDNAPASQLARSIIEGWLGELDPAARRVLALRFDVSPWAEDLQKKGLRSGFALAVNLVSTAKWDRKSGPRNGRHRRAGEHLEAAVRTKGMGVMRDIGRRADWDFASAVRAYATVRGRAASVLPRRAA